MLRTTSRFAPIKIQLVKTTTPRNPQAISMLDKHIESIQASNNAKIDSVIPALVAVEVAHEVLSEVSPLSSDEIHNPSSVVISEIAEEVETQHVSEVPMIEPDSIIETESHAESSPIDDRAPEEQEQQDNTEDEGLYSLKDFSL